MTPTAPSHEDMRMETSLSMTTEYSSSGLSAAIGGTESEQVGQQPTTSVAPPSSIETRPKGVIESSRDPGKLPVRTETTRETSREDALAAMRQFFHAESERRSATEVLATTSTSVPQTDVPPVTSVPVAMEQPEPLPVRTIPYHGTPPRPTATATLRPRTWFQRISEGQIEEEQPRDEDSEESDTLEPLVMEGLPDELGPEWESVTPI